LDRLRHEASFFSGNANPTVSFKTRVYGLTSSKPGFPGLGHWLTALQSLSQWL